MRTIQANFMKKRYFLIATLLCGIFLACGVGWKVRANTGDKYTLNVDGYELYSKAYEMLDYVNEVRKENGVDPLVMDETLLEAAMQRAAETSVEFSHTRPDGSSCSTILEGASYFGENIACESFGSTSYAFQLWMNSSGHKANILYSGFTSIGIGCFYKQYGGGYYWTQVFTNASGSGTAEPADRTVERAITIDGSKYGLEIDYNITDAVDTHRVTIGKTLQLNVVRKSDTSGYSRFTGNSFWWSSSNPSVAAVDTDGTVTVNGAGEAVITAVPRQNLGNAVSISANFSCCPGIENATVEIASSIVWDGTEKTPEVKLSLNGKSLQCGTDYTLTYSNNIDAGTATVTINGCGNYGGTIQKNFTIQPRDISKEAKVSIPGWSFKGYDDEIEYARENAKVVWNGTVLKYGSDYEIYSAGGPGDGSKKIFWSFDIEFTGNYCGSIEYWDETVFGPNANSLVSTANKTSVTLSKSKMTYTGKALKPKVTVKYNGKKLSSKYYKVSYKNNKNPGMATVTVTGKGAYKGKLQSGTTFLILPKKTAIKTPTVGKRSMTVKWSKQAAVSGYQVQIANNRKFTSGTQTKTTSKTSITFQGLTSKQGYYCRVRSYKKIGDKIYYGAWSTVKSKKVK